LRGNIEERGEVIESEPTCKKEFTNLGKHGEGDEVLSDIGNRGGIVRGSTF